MRKAVDRVTEVLTVSLMAIMVVVACWQVFTRFVLNSPSTVSEEFLRYALIWLTMLGAAHAYGKKQHLAVVFLARKIPERFKLLHRLVVEAIVIVFIIVVLIWGGFTAYQNAVGQTSSALGLPIQFLYLSLIVSGVLFLFYAIIHIRDYFRPDKDEELPQ